MVIGRLVIIAIIKVTIPIMKFQCGAELPDLKGNRARSLPSSTYSPRSAVQQSNRLSPEKMLSRRFCRFYPSLSRCYKGQRDYHNDTASIVGSEPDRSSSEFKVGCHLWLFFGASFISSRRSSGRDRVFFPVFFNFFPVYVYGLSFYAVTITRPVYFCRCLVVFMLY